MLAVMLRYIQWKNQYELPLLMFRHADADYALRADADIF